MTNERRATALPLLSCLFLAIFLSGCSTMQQVEPDSGDSLVDLVEHGDEVKITTYNDDVLQFVVAEVYENAIVGYEQTIALEDIRELEIKKLNVPATVGLIVGLTTIGLQVIGVSAGFVPLGY